MCKQETETFVFHTDVYNTIKSATFAIEINDQNVVQFEFINLSNSIVTINNSIKLEPRNSPGAFYRWKEDIQENEKTQSIYKIQMDVKTAAIKNDFGLLVIQKLKAKPR